MKFSAAFMIVATMLAIAYGVVFTSVYPRVPTGNIVALCALGSLATCMAGVGLWTLWTRRS
jgi:hypothetical protein